jgi:hypothetical protein
MNGEACNGALAKNSLIPVHLCHTSKKTDSYLLFEWVNWLLGGSKEFDITHQVNMVDNISSMHMMTWILGS